MMKVLLPSLVFLALCAPSLIGCSRGANATVTESDKLAQSDPNARAQQLLNEFSSAEDPPAWVQQNTFALIVFEKVTDPNIRQQYDSKIAPLLAPQPR